VRLYSVQIAGDAVQRAGICCTVCRKTVGTVEGKEPIQENSQGQTYHLIKTRFAPNIAVKAPYNQQKIFVFLAVNHILTLNFFSSKQNLE